MQSPPSNPAMIKKIEHWLVDTKPGALSVVMVLLAVGFAMLALIKGWR